MLEMTVFVEKKHKQNVALRTTFSVLFPVRTEREDNEVGAT